MATIGVLTTSYPHSGDPIAGVFVRGMTRALVSRGHRAEVLAPRPSGDTQPVDDAGIQTRWIDYAPSRLRRTFYGAGVPDNVRRDPRAWPGLLSFPPAMAHTAHARSRGWDAVISHWALPNGAVAGAVRASMPHLMVLHSADVHLLRRLPGRALLLRQLARGATEMLFASDALRRDALSWLKPVARADLSRRCHACAMGIDPPEPTASRSALRKKWNLTGPTLLTVGRLVPIKGVRHAIDAARTLGVELLVVGDGPERAELERRASGARVRFLGARTGQDKAELLAAADVFLAPSRELSSGRTEGTPTAVLEAAAAGLPIVASPTGGLTEVFEDGASACLVSPLAIATSVRTLLEDPKATRKMIRRSRRVGLAYRWEALAPRIEQLLFGA
ncbi:MAG: glycosyltransferase family 4 protein [Sandaracinaceae bacterium]